MSKMTNLKKGVVGVCAATMLTGLCVVPAFAADDTKDMTVNLDTSAVAQISVTVPTTPVKGVVDAAGTMTFADNYSFTNTGLLGVKVTKLEVKTDSALNAIKLVDEAAYSGESAGENALNLKASIGSMATPIDLADFTASGGAAVADAPVISGATPTNVELTGQMKNFTSAGVTSEAKFATLTWTITTA